MSFFRSLGHFFKHPVRSLEHDLGKGTTPKEILPGHTGHAERGLPLVLEFLDKINVSKKVRSFVIPSIKFHFEATLSSTLDAKSILNIFNSLDLKGECDTATYYDPTTHKYHFRDGVGLYFVPILGNILVL